MNGKLRIAGTVVASTVILAVAYSAQSDEIVIGTVSYKGVTVVGVRGNDVVFVMGKRQIRKPLAEVSKISLPGNPDFNRAEELLGAAKYDEAVVAYERALAKGQLQELIRDRIKIAKARKAGGHKGTKAPAIPTPDAKCPRCKGTLRVPCPTCRSLTRCTGKKKCEKCSGKGNVTCGECKGNWGKKCPDCKGKGKIRAGSRSDGLRLARVYETCERCDGTGFIHYERLRYYGEDYREEEPGPCRTCGGRSKSLRGKVRCAKCNGAGWVGICDTCKGKKTIPCPQCQGGVGATSGDSSGDTGTGHPDARPIAVRFVADTAPKIWSTDTRALKDYEMLFGKEEAKVTSTQSTQDDAAFADKLLVAAKGLPKSPKVQVLLYEKAHVFGIRHKAGHQTAIQAVELLKTAVPGQKRTWAHRLLMVYQRWYDNSTGEDNRQAGLKLLNLALEIADARVEGGEIEGAVKLYRPAELLAKSLGSERLGDVTTKLRVIVCRQNLQAKADRLQRQLGKDPSNTKVREALILCYVEMDRPAEAVKLLDKNVAPAIRSCLKKAAGSVHDLREQSCIELAQWYDDLSNKASDAGGKILLLLRARMYCNRYLKIHTEGDVARLKGQMLLASVEEKLKKLGAGNSQT